MAPEAAADWQAWLPQGALDAAALDRAMVSLIRGWSEKWCVNNGPRLLGPFAPRGTERAVSASTAKVVPGDELRWQVLDEGVGLGVANRALGALAASILDADLRETSLTAQDRELIERVTTECLDDLRGGLTDLLRIPREKEWLAKTSFQPAAGGWSGRIGIKDREPLIHLVVPNERMIALRKVSVRHRGGTAGLRPLAEGLRKQRIGLSAHLGRCAMTLSDFSALAAGDVLVMDKDLNEPLKLAVDGHVKAGSCVIEEQDERLLLKISNPLFG